MRRSGPKVATFASAALVALMAGGTGWARHPESEERVAPPPAAQSEEPFALPPDPYAIISRSLLQTPPLNMTELTPPVSVAKPLRQIFGIARGDPGAALARLRDPSDPASGVAGADLVAAVFEARLAVDRENLRVARWRLRSALNGRAVASLRAFASLELARAELALGLDPEAAASARRAVRDAHGEHDAFSDAARLVQAEALHQSGRGERARVLYDRLLRSTSPRIVAAAALRRADTDFDLGRPVPDYETLLADVAALGVDPRPWAPRASESAIRSGDLESAERWLVRFTDGGAASRVQAAAAIRLADLEVARGETLRARERLESVEALHRNEAVGALAGVRLVALGLLEGDGSAATKRLFAAAESPQPSVAAYANALLGRRLLEQGQLDESIRALGRASRSASNPVAEQTTADLVSALRAAVSDSQDGDCSRLLMRLAIRRTHLMEIVSDPDPFLRLGACFEEIGLHATAMEIYRSLARALGPVAAEPISLPLARSSLAVGEIAAAHARALAHAPDPESSPEWRFLLVRSSLASGEQGPALEVLVRLVRSDSPQLDPSETLALLARTALEFDPSPATIQLLDEKLSALSAEPREGDEDAAGEAALLTATMQRRSGNVKRARVLYRMATEILQDGWRRTEAAYWLGRLGGDAEAASEVFEVSAADPATAQMARLGESALAVARLNSRLGMRPRATASATGSP
ncbi:MAG: tetratricopeptide repeat protein [Myxococcota bacterium]